VDQADGEEMNEWHPINTAEETSDKVYLKGRYPKSDKTIEIIGYYDTGGWTEGWVDERRNTFYATHWKPLNATNQT